MHSKDTIKKTKRPPTEWEKIFAHDISVKILIAKTYKELIQFNIQKTTQFKNGQKTRIDTFSKKAYGCPIGI